MERTAPSSQKHHFTPSPTRHHVGIVAVRLLPTRRRPFSRQRKTPRRQIYSRYAPAARSRPPPSFPAPAQAPPKARSAALPSPVMSCTIERPRYTGPLYLKRNDTRQSCERPAGGSSLGAAFMERHEHRLSEAAIITGRTGGHRSAPSAPPLVHVHRHFHDRTPRCARQGCRSLTYCVALQHQTTFVFVILVVRSGLSTQPVRPTTHGEDERCCLLSTIVSL
jgi:hypothetical protein